MGTTPGGTLVHYGLVVPGPPHGPTCLECGEIAREELKEGGSFPIFAGFVELSRTSRGPIHNSFDGFVVPIGSTKRPYR